MSLRTVPQQFRIYCDLRLASDCLGFSHALMMNLGQAGEFLAKTRDWVVVDGASVAALALHVQPATLLTAIIRQRCRQGTLA